jgi:hypothetical protein
MIDKIPAPFKAIVETLGTGSTAGALFLNIKDWVTSLDVNVVLTLTISTLSIIYLIMKIYDQWLTTRQKKKGG